MALVATSYTQDVMRDALAARIGSNQDPSSLGVLIGKGQTALASPLMTSYQPAKLETDPSIGPPVVGKG